MKNIILSVIILMCGAVVAAAAAKTLTIKTKNISREISVEEGRLTTTGLTNLIISKKLQLKESAEFRLRISAGTHIEGPISRLLQLTLR